MNDYTKNERTFDLKPVGVKYICEFCGEGEMISTNDPVEMLMTDPPKMGLINHRCNACGKTMKLPRSYPYIRWEEVK